MEIALPSNWLITGGCGFIGRSLISRLQKATPAVNIRVLDNLSAGTRGDLEKTAPFTESGVSGVGSFGEGIELVVGDITNPEDCSAAAREAKVIVHLAANTGVAPSVARPRFDMESNVTGTFNMLEAARAAGTASFVFASSGAPLGEVEPPIHEELAPHPVSPYGASKLAGEAYCSAFHHTFGISTVALRFGNVYGPLSARKESVVARFFRRALAGEVLEVYGDGTQTRDFLYIDDLTEAILLAVASGAAGEVFQIATFREVTVNEIALAVKKIVEADRGRTVEIAHKEPRLGDVRRNYSDISKARRILGFEPKTALQEGLEKTYRYFIDTLEG